MRIRADDRGVTLVELLVTVALMSIAFLAILGGLGMFLRSESAHRTIAQLDGELRSYSEALLVQPYADCAAPDAYQKEVAVPDGYTAKVTVAYWDGALPAGFGPTCTTDRGVQQLTVVLRDADGTSGSLIIGKSR